MTKKKKKYPRTTRELVFNGIGVSAGIAMGPVFFVQELPFRIDDKRFISEDQIQLEIDYFKNAIEKTKEELILTVESTKARFGNEFAAIFESHYLLVDDPEIIQATTGIIEKELLSAQSSYFKVMKQNIDSLTASKNTYLRERVLDVQDVKRRVIANMKKRTDNVEIPVPSVIVAHSLNPSDLISLERAKILGFITEVGSKTSHAAIIARAMGVPSIVGVEDVISYLKDRQSVLVDGKKGELVINPNKSTINSYRKRLKQLDQHEKELAVLKDLDAVTLDGRVIQLSANIEFPLELDAVLEYGAHGVGLYRTEYLLLQSEQMPSEEIQYAEYLNISKKIGKKDPLTIRTFDIGGDKIPVKIMKAIGYRREDNPFLGWRATRIFLHHTSYMKQQIRTILRISGVKKGVRLMFPMIASLEEIRAAKKLVHEVKNELQREKVKFDPNIEIGVMIEIPSAAMIADELAAEVDFFSIGTNDLVQYTMAADRGNPKVSYLNNYFNPAVLRLIRMIIRAGQSRGIKVSMCGEMAANPYATILLVGLGLDEFSTSPIAIPEVKRIVRSIEYREAREISDSVMGLKLAEEVEKEVMRITADRFPDIEG